MVYGAAKIGIMGQAEKGVIDNRGKTIGVIPEFLKLKEVYHPNLTELLVTDNMQDRKVIMYERSDGFMILPGGFDTRMSFSKLQLGNN